MTFARALFRCLFDKKIAEGQGEELNKMLTFVPIRRLGGPEEIADADLWLGSSAASYVTGQVELSGRRLRHALGERRSLSAKKHRSSTHCVAAIIGPDVHHGPDGNPKRGECLLQTGNGLRNRVRPLLRSYRRPHIVSERLGLPPNGCRHLQSRFTRRSASRHDQHHCARPPKGVIRDHLKRQSLFPSQEVAAAHSGWPGP